MKPELTPNGQRFDGFFRGSPRPLKQMRQNCACRAISYMRIMRGARDKGRIHPVSGLPDLAGIEYRASDSSGGNTTGSMLKHFNASMLQRIHPAGAT